VTNRERFCDSVREVNHILFLPKKIIFIKAVEDKVKRIYTKKIKGGSDHFEKA
jgi:hypothetical protein